MFYAAPQDILGRVERTLGPETGLYRRGYNLARHELRLSFIFPRLARQRYREACEAIVADTGWRYTINDSPHQGRLAEAALACLPPGVTALKPPAMHLGRHEVAVTVDAALDAEAVQHAIEAFSEQTGYTLRLHGPHGPLRVVTGEAGAEVVPAAPMEINAARDIIIEAFREAPESWRPARISVKNDHTGKYIELAFITAQVGQRQEATLAALGQRLGWRLRPKPQPNQQALVELALQLLPNAWQLSKTPSIHVNARMVRARCAAAPAPGDPQVAAVCHAFQEAVGYGLEVSQG